MVALNDEEATRLEHAARARRARSASARHRRTRDIEPLVTAKCVAGLLMPDEGVIDPMALTTAYADLAVTNGASVRLGAQVDRIERLDDGGSLVSTPRGRVRARFVVNAAGVHAGRIAQMADGEELRCWPRKGQYAVIDRLFAERLSKIVFCTHSPDTKGINVVPTTHGSALLGPTVLDIDDPEDRSTDRDTVAALVASGARSGSRHHHRSGDQNLRGQPTRRRRNSTGCASTAGSKTCFTAPTGPPGSASRLRRPT